MGINAEKFFEASKRLREKNPGLTKDDADVLVLMSVLDGFIDENMEQTDGPVRPHELCNSWHGSEPF